MRLSARPDISAHRGSKSERDYATIISFPAGLREISFSRSRNISRERAKRGSKDLFISKSPTGYLDLTFIPTKENHSRVKMDPSRSPAYEDTHLCDT